MGGIGVVMVVAAAWYLSNFFRKDPDRAGSREPSGWRRDYLTNLVIDPRRTAYKNALRRSYETVLRGGVKDDRVVATLLTRFDTVPFKGTRHSITLDTSEYLVELETKPTIVWPWELDPVTTFDVTVDGTPLGTMTIEAEQVVARDAGGDVGRWLTGPRQIMPYEEEKPKQGQLLGKVSGWLRVATARLKMPRDFVDQPFYTEAEGDERWLLAFLAVAASRSMLVLDY